jgi:hypothetical protein
MFFYGDSNRNHHELYMSYRFCACSHFRCRLKPTLSVVISSTSRSRGDCPVSWLVSGESLAEICWNIAKHNPYTYIMYIYIFDKMSPTVITVNMCMYVIVWLCLLKYIQVLTNQPKW